MKLYLANPPERVQKALLRIVPVLLQDELRVQDWKWIDELTNEAGTGHFDMAVAQVQEDEDLYAQLIQEAAVAGGERGYSRAAYYARVRQTIRDRDLLNFLGQRGVLPKYGFPVDVVELKTDHIPDEVARDVELQRDLRIALSEYAPTGQIVAGKRLFTSGGLYKQPRKDWEKIKFGICPQCGRFNQFKGEEATSCRTCGTSLPFGKPNISGEMLIPEFGFVARREETLPTPGESRPPRTYSSRVYFNDYSMPTQPDGTDLVVPDETFVDVPDLGSAGHSVKERQSRFGELVVINHGPDGRGFEVCSTCGYSTPAPEAPPVGGRRGRRSTTQSKGHKNPRTGRDCPGTTWVYRLGHKFVTDVLELHIDGITESSPLLTASKNPWRSILYALVEGASQALGIRRNDLNGTLYQYSTGSAPALILYDDVPGGAGHVQRIAEELPLVFKTALERIQECECGPETACHECLWNYSNQPYHNELSRGLAVDLLTQIMGLSGG